MNLFKLTIKILFVITLLSAKLVSAQSDSIYNSQFEEYSLILHDLIDDVEKIEVNEGDSILGLVSGISRLQHLRMKYLIKVEEDRDWNETNAGYSDNTYGSWTIRETNRKIYPPYFETVEKIIICSNKLLEIQRARKFSKVKDKLIFHMMSVDN